MLGAAEIFLLKLIEVDGSVCTLCVMHAQLMMFLYRYVLRVEAMKVFLEFSDKKAELQPALHVLCTAVNGIIIVLWVVLMMSSL